MSSLGEILENLDCFEINFPDFEVQSQLHGPMHTMRVMAWVCVLALKNNLVAEGRLAFFAAVVHDMGRCNDGYGPKHGQRSADLHLPKWKNRFQKFGLTESEYNSVYEAVRWHSKDNEPPANHPVIAIINLLKDADGLDRVRLEPEGPRGEYLRFGNTAELVPAAQLLLSFCDTNPKLSLHDIVDKAFELAKK